MCRACIAQRAQIAEKLMGYHVEMLNVLGSAVIEGKLSDYMFHEHPSTTEAEHRRVVADVSAAQLSVWTAQLSERVRTLFDSVVLRGTRECARSLSGESVEESADSADLDGLMRARQGVEDILRHIDVQYVIDDATDDGEDEES